MSYFFYNLQNESISTIQERQPDSLQIIQYGDFALWRQFFHIPLEGSMIIVGVDKT